VRNYEAYIGAAECYAAVRTEVKDIEILLETLSAQLPDLKRGCEAFVKGAEEIAKARKMNKTLMNNSGTMSDLLEIPKLLDACVRNGYYDEALDLENFIAKMEMTHGHIGLIKKLADDARTSSSEMLHTLLGRLKVGIQLPECLRVVGFLRRLSAYDEVALRQTFLACREEYIANMVSDLDDSNPYDYLKKLTDTHRVSLFDVVMQFRAIFSDDADVTQTEADDGKGSLLYSWATHRISKYLELMRATLPHIYEGGALASIHEHCEYCGTSLARVGLDTRPLFRPLFADAAATIFENAVSTAVDELERALESSTWSTPSTSSQHPETDDTDGPPRSLIDHAPVAAFVNGTLLAFNELRHLTVTLEIRDRLTSALESSITRAAGVILAFYQATDSILRRDERKLDAFLASKDAFVVIAAPYLASAFIRLIGGTDSNELLRRRIEGVSDRVKATLAPVTRA